jgi:hypothetical protein
VFTVRSSPITSLYVATAVTDAYAKIVRLAPVLRVLDDMPEKNAVSWIELIGSLSRAAVATTRSVS